MVPGLWKTLERKGKCCFHGILELDFLWICWKVSVNSKRFVLKLSEPVEYCFPFNNAACTKDLVMLLLVWWAFFFPPVLIFDVSCQIHMDRHLHCLTDVDVGKRLRHVWTYVYVCKQPLSLWRLPHTYTHRQINSYSRKGAASVKTWPFSVCNLLAVGVNVTHTWCVMHLAYGRRG